MAGAAFLLALALGACGGGGGGGGGAPAATNFNTVEFQANFGLGNINVLSTYDGGFTGTGQTIAVIDTGIDVDHPDLDANIAAASTDIVTGNAAFLNDIDGHGTQVAGVAAAEHNGVGTHGVAFNSQILAIRADSIGSCLTLCTFNDTDVADGIDFAVANGAGVINLSLGGGASSADFLASVQAAVDAGVILTIAAGNTGGANPLNPANLATNRELQWPDHRRGCGQFVQRHRRILEPRRHGAELLPRRAGRRHRHHRHRRRHDDGERHLVFGAARGRRGGADAPALSRAERDAGSERAVGRGDRPWRRGDRRHLRPRAVERERRAGAAGRDLAARGGERSRGSARHGRARRLRHETRGRLWRFHRARACRDARDCRRFL